MPKIYFTVLFICIVADKFNYIHIKSFHNNHFSTIFDDRIKLPAIDSRTFHFNSAIPEKEYQNHKRIILFIKKEVMKKMFVLTFLILLQSGCMYKSVMNSEADDIIKARIYSYNNKNYLVMLESVFQATSKKGGQGITTITGFNEQRISVYNISDGSLVIRKKTGKAITFPIVFLGCTKGNLWFYTPIEGVHSLDPETLEIKVKQDDILEKSPELRNNLATCEWYQLPQYFQFNEIKQQIILTDNKGFRYFLDTDSLLTTKILSVYHPLESRYNKPFEKSITFPEPHLYMKGDLRTQIEVEGTILAPDLTFLEGEFIVDRNPARIIEGIDNRLSFMMIKAEDIYPKILSLNSLNGGRGPRWGEKLRDSLNKLEHARYNLEADIKETEKCRTEIQQSGHNINYTQLLSPDTKNFFVFHKASTAKDAQVIISRIQMRSNNEMNELWSTEIPRLFFNPSAASETTIFKEVFSKGSPEFRFSHFDISGNNLIIVWMLHVHCIDIVTGKVLWRFRV